MLFQWSMYYLAFAPLWLSVIAVDVVNLFWHKTGAPYVEIISLIIIPLVFIFAICIMKKKFKPVKVGSTAYDLQEAKEEKLGTAEFLATFIFPLFAFDFTTWEGVVLFAIFFFAFGWLCRRHNYFCTNIMLDIMKYRIYECKLTDLNGNELDKKIISKRILSQFVNETVYIKGLNNDYSFDCLNRSELEDEAS